MKKIITFIAVATLPFLIISCKKDNSGNTTLSVNKFSTEGLAWVQLPLNKYFIYKDSATGIIDSVVVTESKLENIYVPKYQGTGIPRPDFYYQQFTLLLTKYSGTPGYWFYGIANNFSFFTSVFETDIDLKERDSINNADRSNVFSYPGPYNSYLSPAITMLPSITIEGKTYSNVEIYTYANSTDPTQSNYRKSIYYWAKGIGIIKREIQTSGTTKTDLLVRYG